MYKSDVPFLPDIWESTLCLTVVKYSIEWFQQIIFIINTGILSCPCVRPIMIFKIWTLLKLIDESLLCVIWYFMSCIIFQFAGGFNLTVEIVLTLKSEEAGLEVFPYHFIILINAFSYLILDHLMFRLISYSRHLSFYS